MQRSGFTAIGPQAGRPPIPRSLLIGRAITAGGIIIPCSRTVGGRAATGADLGRNRAKGSSGPSTIPAWHSIPAGCRSGPEIARRYCLIPVARRPARDAACARCPAQIVNGAAKSLQDLAGKPRPGALDQKRRGLGCRSGPLHAPRAGAPASLTPTKARGSSPARAPLSKAGGRPASHEPKAMLSFWAWRFPGRRAACSRPPPPRPGRSRPCIRPPACGPPDSGTRADRPARCCGRSSGHR